MIDVSSTKFHTVLPAFLALLRVPATSLDLVFHIASTTRHGTRRDFPLMSSYSAASQHNPQGTDQAPYLLFGLRDVEVNCGYISTVSANKVGSWTILDIRFRVN